MNIDQAGGVDSAAASLIAQASAVEASKAPRATFTVECIGADGQVKWTDECQNVVTTEGKIAILERMFRTAVTPAWYMLLKGTGAPAATDTLASHATWSELTPYAGNRPAITFNAAAANGANGRIVSQTVAYSINAGATVSGLGCSSVASGTAGTLYNAVNFTGGDRGVQSGDTLNVTVTLDMT